MSKRGLGKGLGALFDAESLLQNNAGQATVDLSGALINLDLGKISPNRFQPRQIFDEAALQELAESIKESGVIQPIIVREKNHDAQNAESFEKEYELVAGERRWLASKMAGLETIPAIVHNYSDLQMLEIALVENLQRQDLNPIEEAWTFRRLMNDFELTQEEIARRIGRSRPVISNCVRLLNLTPKIQDFILNGVMSAGQAKPLLAIEDEMLQLDLAVKIIDENYSARDAETLVRGVISQLQNSLSDNLDAQTATAKPVRDDFFVSEYEDRLKLLLGAKVKIKPGKIKSKIEIEFYSNEDLERIIEAFSANAQEQSNYVPKFDGKLVV